MTFDILYYTDEELAQLSEVQMQLLRTAQKRKNDLERKMQNELTAFKKMLLTNGMKHSSLYPQKAAQLQEEFNYQVFNLREQLVYAMDLNTPFPDESDDREEVGYTVDYTLSYADRYALVRAYYFAIDDPMERLNLYGADEVAKRYLGEYYTILYNVLYSYAR